jgi:hypothetical protein
MTTASLSLLKGAKKKEIANELEKVAPSEEPKSLDDMTSEQIDAFLTSNGVDLPEAWADFAVEQKREWVNSQFDFINDGADANASELNGKVAEAEVAEETAKAQAEEMGLTENPVEKKTKGKKSKKTGADVAIAAKEGEIVEDDLIQDLVHEIENMKEKPARQLVAELAETAEVTFFKLGGVLSVIQAHGWHEPYASFREFVEKEHGLAYRKATYWIEIYNCLAQAGIPWGKVKKLGWTKLKEIARVLTVDNVDEWVELANQQNTLTLIETVKNHLAKDAPKALEDQSAKTVTTKTFKVHEDQKATIEAAIGKAKEISGSSVDTAALEFICLDFMGSQTMPQKLKAMGLEQALHAVEQAFPNAKINVELDD